MVKKIVFFLVLFITPFLVNAEAPSPPQFDDENDFVIETVGTGLVARISGYNGTNTEVRIPMQIRRMPIVGIRERAFYNRGFTSVSIPNSVILIESQAFMGNEITQISIGTNVSCYQDAFGFDFTVFYNENGRRAGTYIYRDGLWSIQPGPGPAPRGEGIPAQTPGAAPGGSDLSIDYYATFSLAIGLWDYGPSVQIPNPGLHLGLLLNTGSFKMGIAGQGLGFVGLAFPDLEDTGFSYGYYFGSSIELFFHDTFGFNLGAGIIRGFFRTENNTTSDYLFPFVEVNLMMGDEEDSWGTYFRYYFNDSDKFYNKFALGIRRRGF